MKLTDHFESDEFLCHCGKCGDGNRMQPEFIFKLQRMRHLIDRPIVITSGYRCRFHNIDIGGHPGSQHVLGNAADLMVEGSAHRYDLLRYATEVGFTGIGVASTFVHVDCRKTQPVSWIYG